MPRVKTENLGNTTTATATASPATKKARKLEDLTGPELVERYNNAADRLERNHVKRFKNRAQGMEKVQAIEEELKPAKKSRGPIEDPERSSGAYIRELIMEGGRTRQEVADLVLERFPDHKTTTSDVSWNRWKMRKDGHDVPAFTRKAPAKKSGSKDPGEPQGPQEEDQVEGMEA